MGTVTKIKVGSHYDPNDGWAREPKFSNAIDLDDHRRRRDMVRVDRMLGALLWFALGYVLGFMVWG